MDVTGRERRSRIGTIGWVIVLVVSGLLVFQGVTWYFSGPETALDNIAERTPLGTDAFRQGDISAFDVITIVTRQQAVYGAALGLLTLLVAWRGYHRGSPWAWRVAWVFVAAVGVVGLSFTLGGGAAVGSAYLGAALLALVGLLLARRDIAA